MRTRRLKVSGADACYHVMTRTVSGERLLGDREKELATGGLPEINGLRKQVFG